MSDTSEIQKRLHEVARMLREARGIDTESQRVLAELVAELNTALQTANVPAPEVSHLAESTAHLAESLHHQHDKGILGKARERLEGAMLNAEVHSPNAVGLARRLLDALSNIGI
jgi:hypothetical protein